MEINHHSPEIPPSVLASKTRLITDSSSVDAAKQQLEAERLLLSKLKKYHDLTEETPDFSTPLDDSEQARYWRILWNVLDSGSHSNIDKDKKTTLAVLRRIISTKSRYIGIGVGSSRLFVSEAGVITKIIPGNSGLTVVWPTIKSLKKEIVECEMRIQYLKRITAQLEGGKHPDKKDNEEFSAR
jgi:hypothetical protein